MELKDILGVVRARWRLVAAGILAGLAAAVALNLSTTPLYESSIRFFVSAADVSAPSDAAAAYQGDLLSQQRAASYAELLTEKALAGRVVAEMGLPLTPTEVAEKVTARPVANTVLLDATVTDTSPERARDIADVLGRRFAAQVAELETPAGATRPTVEVTIIHPPELNPDPVRPVVARNIAIGMVLGLLAGVCLALLRHRLDQRITTSAHVREATGEAPVAVVPQDPHLGRQPVASGQGRPSASAEAFRAIRGRLELHDVNGPPRVVVVTSAMPEEGRTTLAVNLAAALGRSGHRVLLIEADLRQSGLAAYVGVPGRPGLVDVLSGTAALDDVTQPWEDGKVTVLTAGVTPTESSDGMPSTRMREILRTARETHDFVVLDAPPLLLDPDAVLLTALADGCLLTARYGMSRVDQLAEAVAMLSRVDATLLGVVLNGVPQRDAGARHRRRYPVDPGPTVDPSTADPTMASPRGRTARRSGGGLVPAARSQDGGPAT